MQFKPGMVVITQGDPESFISKAIKWATGSWWTHGFVVISETEAVEAVIPRVRRMNIQERIKELEDGKRDYVVMELAKMTDEQRKKVADAGLSFVGRMYDIWGCLFFVVFQGWYEGTKRVVCSRLMSASYYDGIEHNIFTGVFNKLPFAMKFRAKNLEDGYCTPDEVLRYSDLVVVMRFKG